MKILIYVVLFFIGCWTSYPLPDLQYSIMILVMAGLFVLGGWTE